MSVVLGVFFVASKPTEHAADSRVRSSP
jgi:hypothetical protein